MLLRRVVRKILNYYKYKSYIYIQKTSRIEAGTKVYNPSNLYMGKETRIGPCSTIMNPRAKFIMKDFSFSARELLVIDGNHMSVIGIPLCRVTDTMKDELDIEHKYNQDVVVEEDVWLGARVTLLSGSHVGRGSIVAAGAVVNGKVLPYSIVGGVPAKFIKFKWSIEEIMKHELALYPEKDRFTENELKMFFLNVNK